MSAFDPKLVRLVRLARSGMNLVAIAMAQAVGRPQQTVADTLWRRGIVPERQAARRCTAGVTCPR